MYHLLKQHRVSTLLVSEGSPALLALGIAEIFFKWHSFVLECAGFLATWYGISWLWSRLLPSRALAREADHGR